MDYVHSSHSRFRHFYNVMVSGIMSAVVTSNIGLLTLTLTLTFQGYWVTAKDADPRITTYEDVISDPFIAMYSHPDIIEYSHLVTDIPGKQILVGARNNLLRLNMTDLRQLEVVSWQADDVTQRICQAKGQTTEHCQNYIRVLELLQDRVLICGTYAFSPKCSWRKVSDLSDVISYVPGMAKCPYDPQHNNTALLTSDGNLYSTTVTDFTARDPAIFRSLGPNKMLRTVRYNSRWLNEPHFVSSHEIGDFVYFFFRESAIEYINCGKNIYSRVARVCKNDQGGSNYLLEDNWTTFVKSRLNCSLPGTHPFYFNELQGTYYVASQNMMYGIFTTSPTSIYGTAVCVYNITSFDEAFTGSFKYQENTQSIWTRVSNSGAHQCDQSASSRLAAPTNQTPGQRKLVDAMKYQIMDDAVQPVTTNPMLVAEDERFSHIVVDTVLTKHQKEFNVIFVVTLEGAVKKYIQLQGHELCVIEHIQVVPPGSKPGIVRTIKIVHEQGMLFVGTLNEVYRIPVHRCHRFTTKSACVGAQDPYCGWNDQVKACTTAPPHLRMHHWHQDIKSCPTQQITGVRGWSKWSDWDECEQGDGTDSVASSHCMCRHRKCYGEDSKQECSGTSVQVTNCTVHGGWTAWSLWSSCSASCGIAVRARHRYCGNPEPQFGGRLCVGPDVDETYCLENPECPVSTVPPVDGEWSAWSGWSPCTKRCGAGVSTRERACSSPLPLHGGRYCVGNSLEWKQCNTQECDERRRTEWSEWQSVNTTKDGSTQERIRFTCRAPVEDGELIRINNIKHDSRFCPTGVSTEDECTKRGPEANEHTWSPWSQWTTCSQLCDEGNQSRRRICLPSGDSCACEDHAVEVRICNTHACQGQWSCWSDYSACSATCGAGRRWRKRQCQAGIPGGHYTQPCPSSDREEMPCTDLPPCEDCSGTEGWGEWTRWSVCSPQNTRLRRRICCARSTLHGLCDGPGVESRICQYNEIPQIGLRSAAQGEDIAEFEEDVKTSAVQESAAVDGGASMRITCRECFCMYHLIIVGIVGFILGGVICVGILLYCQRQQQENKDQDKYNTLQRMNQQTDTLQRLHQRSDSFKNDYVTPSELNSPHNQTSIDLIPFGTSTQYYSSGSLKHKDSYKSLTVREASQKRDSLMRTNSMRTNLSLSNMEY